MAWNNVAANQMVSYTDAQTSGFTLNPGYSHITNEQCMTKNDWLLRYDVNSSNLSSYSTNQLIRKDSLIANVSGPIWNYIVANPSEYDPFSIQLLSDYPVTTDILVDFIYYLNSDPNNGINSSGYIYTGNSEEYVNVTSVADDYVITVFTTVITPNSDTNYYYEIG